MMCAASNTARSNRSRFSPKTSNLPVRILDDLANIGMYSGPVSFWLYTSIVSQTETNIYGRKLGLANLACNIEDERLVSELHSCS
jgi:hypothetical protein